MLGLGNERFSKNKANPSPLLILLLTLSCLTSVNQINIPSYVKDKKPMADKLSRSPVLGLIALVKFLLNFCAFWVHFLRNYYSSSTSISHICRSDQAWRIKQST